MLRAFRKKLGDMMNIVLGRNSATRRITPVDIIVLRIRTRRSDRKSGVSRVPSNLEKNNPYITSAMLLPISMVAMYWPGLLVNVLIIRDPETPCFRSSSIRSLFEVTKAISIPEKNAEKKIARSMISIPFIPQS